MMRHHPTAGQQLRQSQQLIDVQVEGVEVARIAPIAMTFLRYVAAPSRSPVSSRVPTPELVFNAVLVAAE